VRAKTEKPQWALTHYGENNEKLCECEGKYYTLFSWDYFLPGYTGKVTPALSKSRWMLDDTEPLP